MGYDVHITRREYWASEEEPEIMAQEWFSYIQSDPEIRLDGFAETGLDDGNTFRYDNETMAVWLAYSKHLQDNNMAWFYHFDGNIEVKNPDTEILQKMWRIAQALSARVQGDDGEFYDELGDVLKEVDVNTSVPQKPWWKIW